MGYKEGRNYIYPRIIFLALGVVEDRYIWIWKLKEHQQHYGIILKLICKFRVKNDHFMHKVIPNTFCWNTLMITASNKCEKLGCSLVI